jgi:hypothetical protein
MVSDLLVATRPKSDSLNDTADSDYQSYFVQTAPLMVVVSIEVYHILTIN